MNLPPVYNPHEIEARLYAEWERANAFRPDTDPSKAPFTIVIPPPNVTGILHMGHALNNTLQDILIRFRRMQGYAALWVPGTDHAGIATQNVVERQLAQEGLTRQQLGREKFVERVWEWRRQYGSTIVQQLRRLGASCDWSRERFTMDEGLSRAVQTAFLELHRAGLIYRGYYLVNWCPRCQTALSDEEVAHEEVKGHLWYIRYPTPSPPSPLSSPPQGVWGPLPQPPRRGEGRGEGIVVATTRPETMLGDVAVAVHPEDLRYKPFHGKSLTLPILKRPLAVVPDPFVDPKFGTGAVKVTPAHDMNDFLLGQRHSLEAIQVIGPDGRMTEQAGPYAGLDRFECRSRLLKDLEAQGLLVKTEDYATAIGHCYRCKTVIEPMLSPQWFVKMEPLAKLGIEAVEKDGTRFVPERWTKVYLDWLKNIRDWCISRQIWWGHRIPAWTCRRCTPEYLQRQQRKPLSGTLVMDEGQAAIHVQPSRPDRCRKCGGSDLVQDEDVLDTWFSSWLWPFSTLGWPSDAPDLARFYPTSVLVTAQDIIFFWVARMVMAGKFFMKRIPFRDVAIHGIIRVEGGKKMSKSLGNIIDPLEVIERMGADALRFSLAHMTSEGQDLYLSENKFLLGRNFANKLWNAARLILEPAASLAAGGAGGEASAAAPAAPPKIIGGARTDGGECPPATGPAADSLTLADRWILSRLQRAVREVTAALEAYRFNEAARRLHQFVRHDFCDWYLEIAKLQREQGLSPKGTVPCRTEQILRVVLETTLRLMHPVMPFITEELWQKIHSVRPEQAVHPSTKAQDERRVEGHSTIMLAPWPEADPALDDPEAEEQFGRLQSVITEVRNIRSTFRVPLKQRVAVHIRAEDGAAILTAHERMIQRLGLVERLTVSDRLDRPAGSATAHLGEWDLVVPLAGLVDLSVERRRIEKELAALESRLSAKRARLGDSAFRDKAPAEVVAEEEESLRELEGELARWSESLRQIQ